MDDVRDDARAVRPRTPTFRRAATAEWTRLWTLRSTWLTLLSAAGLLLFVGVAAGAGHDGLEPAPIWKPAQLAMVPGQFAFLVVVVLAVAGEHSTGAIRSSLQWVPRRSVLLAARTLVPVAVVTAAAVALSAVTAAVAWGLVGPAAEVAPWDIAASLGRIALVVGFGGLLSAGLGFLLRSTAGVLTALFLLIFALVVTLGSSGVPWLVTTGDHLPGRAIVSLLDAEGEGLETGKIAAVMAGWTAAALAAGAWSLLDRDAS